LIVCSTNDELRGLGLEILNKEVGIAKTDDFQCVFWVDNQNQIEWVVGYNGFLGKTCHMHMVNLKGGYTPKELLKVAFDYPFNQCKLEKVVGVLNSRNEKAMMYDKKLGFKEVYRLEGLHDDDGDIVYMMMDKKDCRWIRERKHAL